MSHLHLGTFIESYKDFEAGQYRVLAGLQTARTEFSQNRLYPTLAQLIELYRVLFDIVRVSADLRQELPKRIVGLDLSSKKVLYETYSMGREDVVAVEHLIRWALPKLKEAIEEGKTIYNFVDDQMTLEEVGIVPSYVEEGYILAPDTERSTLRVLHYEVTIYSSADQRFRNLKTRHICSYPLDELTSSPWHVKQRLIKEFKNLPNPATYSLNSDIAFPYESTLIPIAKRKLLTKICS